MRSHRFYTPLELSNGQQISLPKEASHHCLQVLRYQLGNQLTLFNGDGFDYLAEIVAIEKKQCQVKIKCKVTLNNESSLKIHLFQGIARGDKMDLIIQKAVELGVNEITPLFSERCNVKLDGKRLTKKLIHWQNVAVSACEQSGRAFIPKVNPPANIRQLSSADSANSNDSLGFYLQPTAQQTLHQTEPGATSETSSIRLYIGPEGGFSDGDLKTLEQSGNQGVRLGPRILRTETAGLACIAVLQARFGDL